PDLRGWEWYYYFSLCHKDLMTLRAGDSVVRSVAWSPDGNRLAATVQGKTIQIWNATTGQEIFKFGAGKDPLWSVAWSPNGKRLATGEYDSSAGIWDAATGKKVFTLRGSN